MTGSPSEERGVSPLDRAHGFRLDGEPEEALRLAASLLAAMPDDLGAALLVARLLVEAERPAVAIEACPRLVDGFIRRGDLLQACLVVRLLVDAGQESSDALRNIAEAFGIGSARAGDVSPKPPPLPQQVEVAPFFKEASGDDLLQKAEKALRRFIKEKDPVAADTTLPRLPLYSALEPAVLELLLGAQKLRELKAGETVVEQGEEGKEAYVVARGVLNVVRDNDAGNTLLAVLGPGAIFGEMALVSQSPRGASVVAVEPSQLFVMEREDLERLAGQEPALARELGKFCHGRMVSNLIRHSSILAAVDPTKREELISSFETRTFEPGEVLVEEGQQTAGLFLIASGGVQVSSKDSDGDTVMLAELGPGDVVGEIALVMRRPATADVVTAHPTVALELTHERFREVIREHPGLLSELYELAAKREEETRSVVAQEALAVEDVILL
jgi:cAMP-dependent protein kinase regulator